MNISLTVLGVFFSGMATTLILEIVLLLIGSAVSVYKRKRRKISGCNKEQNK